MITLWNDNARRFIGHQNSKIKIENAVVSDYDGFSLNANGGTIIELDEEINMTEYQPEASTSKEYE